MLEEEKLDELDIALLRQMEREALLETVYDERRLSDAEIQTLLKERSVRALAEIHRVLDASAGGYTSFCCPLTLGRGDQTMTYPDLIQFCMFLVALISLIYKICNDKKK